MRSSYVWIVFALLTAAGFVELVRDTHYLPSYAVGAALLLLGVLAGVRWGSDAARHLVADLSRTNSYLAEQNDQLSELNYELLSRLNESPAEEVPRD